MNDQQITPRFLGLTKAQFAGVLLVIVASALLLLGASFWKAQENGAKYRGAIKYNCATNTALLTLVRDAVRNYDQNVKAGTYVRLLKAGTITQREYEQIVSEVAVYRVQQRVLENNGPCTVLRKVH